HRSPQPVGFSIRCCLSKPSSNNTKIIHSRDAFELLIVDVVNGSGGGRDGSPPALAQRFCIRWTTRLGNKPLAKTLPVRLKESFKPGSLDITHRLREAIGGEHQLGHESFSICDETPCIIRCLRVDSLFQRAEEHLCSCCHIL